MEDGREQGHEEDENNGSREKMRSDQKAGSCFQEEITRDTDKTSLKLPLLGYYMVKNLPYRIQKVANPDFSPFIVKNPQKLDQIPLKLLWGWSARPHP